MYINRKFEWSSASCVGHDLQLCIKAGLLINETERMVSAVQKLVEHFKKSELANNKSYLTKYLGSHYKLCKMLGQGGTVCFI